MTNEQKTFTILLVEDDDNHAHLIIKSLERNPIYSNIVHLEDGVEALKYLKQEAPYQTNLRPDMVLLDLKLPNLDGHEVLKVIKSSPALASIPVVIMSTSDTEQDREKAYLFHANSYLVKPADFNQFRKMVADLSLYWGVWNVPAPVHNRVGKTHD